MTADRNQLKLVEARFQVSIAAPSERVWAALTGELQQWWPADFYADQGATGIALDLRVGGHWTEHWGDRSPAEGGDGAIWGQVTKLKNGRLLEVESETGIDFGPGRNIIRFELEEEGRGTSLTCIAVGYGPGGSGAMDADGMEQGWRYLLADALKPWVEDGTRPERPYQVQ